MIEIVCTNGFTRYWKRFYSLLETGLLITGNGFTRYWKRIYSFPTTVLLVFRNGFTHVPQRFYSCSATDLAFFGEGEVRLVVGALRLPRVAVGDKGRLALRLLYKV